MGYSASEKIKLRSLAESHAKSLRSAIPASVQSIKKAVFSGKLDGPQNLDSCKILLFAAAQGGIGCKEALNSLLSIEGVEITNVVDADGNSLLHVARLFGHNELADMLVSLGADEQAVNADGKVAQQLTFEHVKSSAFEACRLGLKDRVLPKLEANWVAIDERNSDGKTLVMLASEQGNEKMVKSLMRFRPEINTKDKRGDTAVHICFRNDHVQLAEWLIARGGWPDSRNMDGKTPPQVWKIRVGSVEDDVDSRGDRSPQARAEPSEEAPAPEGNAGAGGAHMHVSSKALMTPELSALKDKFDGFCKVGQSNMGLQGVRTGRGGKTSRKRLLDFPEFCKMLTSEGIAAPAGPISKTKVAAVFDKVNRAYGKEEGELTWGEFKQCLWLLMRDQKVGSVMGVPLEDLKVFEHLPKRVPKEWDEFPLCNMSKSYLEKDLSWMQRKLAAMASRAKEITSCDFAAQGHGVTTGHNRCRPETYSVYAKPLRVHHTKMVLPRFDKDRETERRETVAKAFFNKMDSDQSGELTRYELQKALDDFGFSEEERTHVFSAVDADNSGSVTLHEFIAGMNQGNVSFEGKMSKMNRTETYFDMAQARSTQICRKMNPTQALSISPGLLGHIVKILSEYALYERLKGFQESSCVYAAPKMTAPALDVALKKTSVGTNTRAATAHQKTSRTHKGVPITEDDEAHTHLAADGESPAKHGSEEGGTDGGGTILPPISQGKQKQSKEQGTSSILRDRGRSNSSMDHHHALDHSRAATDFSCSVSTSPPPRVDRQVQSGARSYKDQVMRMSHAKVIQGVNAQRRRVQRDEPLLMVSPDGKLLSEHTRVTLRPHRLTITSAGQAVIAGMDTDESHKNAVGVRNHRITTSGISLLRKVVFVSMSSGPGHCAAVTDTGLLYTWGYGRYGQLGHGGEEDSVIPFPVQGIKGEVCNVSAGMYHTLAVTTSGALFSWGDGRDGKLGHGDEAARLSAAQVTWFAERDVHIATAQAGGSHSVVLSSKGKIYTFGSGQSGRLGHGSEASHWLPTPVASLESVTIDSIAAGSAHTVALSNDGQLYTWGCGQLGRLGHNCTSDEVLPRRLEFSYANATPVFVGAGEAHTCVMRSDGSLITIGRLTHGRVAQGSGTASATDSLRKALELQSADDWMHFPD